jgi:hypothetical protein
MASPLIVVCIIAKHFLHPTPMDTGMGCTGPMSLDDAKTLVTANDRGPRAASPGRYPLSERSLPAIRGTASRSTTSWARQTTARCSKMRS